ncbi:MAG: hypothetical protein SNJ55_07840 [Chloroherpetonaceae bacterium]
MQSHEVISQENRDAALRDELRQMIKADLNRHLQFLKVSPIRRVPPKDLSMDVAWIDGKLKLAKWIQVISLGLLLAFFVAMFVLVFVKDTLVFKPSYSFSIFFATVMFYSLYAQWNKIESLLKLLRKLV